MGALGKRSAESCDCKPKCESDRPLKRSLKEEDQDVARQILSQMRENEELCDIALVVDKNVHKAHRAVLAAASPIFAAMLRSRVNGMDIKELELEEKVTERSLELALEFLYTGLILDLKPGREMLDLLKTASVYELESLIEEIERRLQSSMTLEMCVDAWKLADQYNYPGVQESAITCIENDFDSFAGDSSLTQCPRDLFFKLLRSSCVKVGSESTILEAIIMWVGADDSRMALFETLLELVRLERMSAAELVQAGKDAVECCECPHFSGVVLEMLYRTSQKELRLGIEFTNNDEMECLPIRRSRVALTFLKRIVGLKADAHKAESSWMEAPDKNLKFRLRVCRKQENDEEHHVDVALEIETLKGCGRSQQSRPIRFAIAIRRDKSLPAKQVYAPVRGIAKEGVGHVALMSWKKFTDEMNEYFVTGKDEVVLIAKVILPCNT